MGSVWRLVASVGLLLAMADVGRSVQIDVAREPTVNATAGGMVTTPAAAAAAEVTTTSTTTTAKPPASLNGSTKAPTSPPPSLSNVTGEMAENRDVQQRLGRRPCPVDGNYFCACDLTVTLGMFRGLLLLTYHDLFFPFGSTDQSLRHQLLLRHRLRRSGAVHVRLHRVNGRLRPQPGRPALVCGA